MRNLKLRTKFTFIIVVLTLLMGVVFAIFIQTISLRVLRQELKDKGFYIAQSLAASIADLILTDQVADIQKLIDVTQKDTPDLSYVYIASSQGRVLFHTFEDGFPVELEKINVITEKEELKTVLLKTEKGLIRDVVVPIDGGRVGFMHVGVWEEKVVAIIQRATLLFLSITAVILVFGIGLSYTLIHFTVKPIEEVVAGVEAVGRGELWRKVKVQRKDEIGTLAAAFNRMTDDLSQTYERLWKVQKQLVQSEKLGAVGRLAAGVAHEINNAINSILNGVEILSEKSGQQLGVVEKYLNIIRKEALLCKKIVRNLLDFSRPSRTDVQLIDVNDIIERMLFVLESDKSFRKVRVVKELAEDIPLLEADSSQLQQAFANLALNALDAMPEGGELRISTSYLNSNSEEKPNVQITFEDIGCGIPQELVNHIFEPFFTTKERDKGFGLGLSVVYGIIKAHHGSVDVQSKLGKRTVFIIRLPIRQDGEKVTWDEKAD